MTVTAIIVAAGRGTRAGGDIPKQWQMLQGCAVVSHSLQTLRMMPEVGRLVLVIHPEDAARAAKLGDDLLIVEGGDTRAQSVCNALAALQGTDTTRVLIHDGARPFLTPELVRRLIAALADAPGAAPALPVSDALWRANGNRVASIQSRDGLFRAQTPQAFHFAPILAAHRNHPGHATDDVEVALAAGLDVTIVAGEEDNSKITYPGDLIRAEQRLKGFDMDVRLGNGFDVHAFCAGDHVWVCGVKVAHSHGLLGHSDADVGMHALTDAIYGALGEGDIGTHFPPSDPQWKGAASQIFLRHAVERVAARGYQLSNVDVTLMCERPKIGPHASMMRAALAGIMGIDETRVSVKATTTEKLGFTGREEGIAAMATAALVSL
jgi:2-C-methyl-D-erythritol 4-phosphate cytidylyltransferase/2-C-methyl-D-erythritol 2,4-cyclodiphosphate synthase